MIKKYLSKEALGNGFKILKAAFSGFMDDRALKFSASLAYYTIFSLAPLLLLMITVAGLVLGKDAIQGKVFEEINGVVGNDAAKQIQAMIQNLEMSGKSTISVIIGVVTLIIGATTVFGEIQEEIFLYLTSDLMTEGITLDMLLIIRGADAPMWIASSLLTCTCPSK